MSTEIEVSTLGHTWIFDLDGTLLKHNGYREGGDQLLEGAKNFIDSIPSKDMIIIVTAREEEYRDVTEGFLKANGIRYDHIIFGAPHGERIMFNDRKSMITKMSIGVTVERNAPLDFVIRENPDL